MRGRIVQEARQHLQPYQPRACINHKSNKILAGRCGLYMEDPSKNENGSIRSNLESELDRHRGILERLMEERTRELANAIKQLRQEISVRELAEMELSEIRERYDLATQAVRVGVWDWNVETNEFYLDPNVKAILGYTDGEIPNDLNTWFEFVHPDDRENVAATIQEHLEGKTLEFVNQRRMIHKDGSTKWIMARGQAIRNKEGKVTRVVGTDADITDFKTSDIALHESEERYRAVIEQSGDCIFLVELKTRRILEANRSLSRLLGYEKEDIPSLTLYDVLDHEKADVDEKIRSIIKNKGCFLGERRYRRRDGRTVDAEVSVNLITYGGKEVMCVVARDITDRKKQELERKKLEAQISESQRLESLGVLAGGVAHDFNNILVGILGSASLALEELPRGSSVRALVEQIEQSSRRAAELSKQLLAYSGNGRFVVAPLDLSELVREMRDLLAASISRDVAVEYRLESGGRMIEADATELRQVLMNLVINAAEASAKPGVITVATGEEVCGRAYLDSAVIGTDAGEGEYVFLEVSDTGCGMDDEMVSRIFDPYFSTKQSGRGLGLAAVLGIVKGHRGALRVKSKPGGGSAFRVLFPVSSRQVERPVEKIPREAAGRRKGFVLVVDDEKTVRNLSRRMLESNGFKVMTAVDGQDGVDVFRKHSHEIEVVLLDLTMPRLNGEQTFERLRAIRDDVNVVFSSGYSVDTITKYLARTDHVRFIQKPYHTYELINVIREFDR